VIVWVTNDEVVIVEVTVEVNVFVCVKMLVLTDVTEWDARELIDD